MEQNTAPSISAEKLRKLDKNFRNFLQEIGYSPKRIDELIDHIKEKEGAARAV